MHEMVPVWMMLMTMLCASALTGLTILAACYFRTAFRPGRQPQR